MANALRAARAELTPPSINRIMNAARRADVRLPERAHVWRAD